MRWHKKEIEGFVVRELQKKYGVEKLFASILARRGITAPEDVLYYLEKDMRHLHNPFLFQDMKVAVDRILQAAEEKEIVMIFGDSDADGVCATTLALESLQSVGIDAAWAVPQADDAYGLSLDVVEKFATHGGSLIITVDCGISNHKEIERAAELGIDVIVTDHHLLQHAALPPALAVINPNVENTTYPFRYLSGCGVAYKLFVALCMSQTEIYKEEIVLLNVVPLVNAYSIETVQLTNLAEKSRVLETIVPNQVRPVRLEQTRLLKILQDRKIFCWNAETQKRLLGCCFGNSFEIGLFDLATEAPTILPQTAGKSLLQLSEISKTARYKSTHQLEIDILKNIFISVTLARIDCFGKSDTDKLQLVALSTIADMMPLQNENRILVKQGLLALNKKPRKGIFELLQKLSCLGKPLDSGSISWYLSPSVNAAGRLGAGNKAVSLFISDSVEERQELANQIMALNDTRRKLVEDNIEALIGLALHDLPEQNNKLAVLLSETIPKGLTGLVANSVAKSIKSPTILGTSFRSSFTTVNQITGSIRAGNGFPIKTLLEFCSDLFIDFGGHEAAAGFSMDITKWPEFKNRCKVFCNNLVLEESEDCIEIDAEIPAAYMTPDLIKVCNVFEPFGVSNKKINFLTRGAVITNAQILGKQESKHLKLTLDFAKHRWPALYWNAAEKLQRDFSFDANSKSGDAIDIVFNVSLNHFNGMEQGQLELLDARKCTGITNTAPSIDE